MAIIKKRIVQKTDAGQQVVHLETSSDIVLHGDKSVSKYIDTNFTKGGTIKLPVRTADPSTPEAGEVWIRANV